MRTKISKVAKDLNVGVSTAVEFLRKHNIEVEEGNINARIDDDAVQLLNTTVIPELPALPTII